MKKILLIDDKPEIRSRLNRELTRHGYRTIPAGEGREGLEKLFACGWDCDCVVSDITMPGMNGWDLLLHLRRLRNDLPLINIALHSDLGPSSREKGAWHFWGKTENTLQLIRRIETVSRRSRELQRQRRSPRHHLDGEIVILGPEQRIQGRLFNISLRGVLFEIDHTLRPEKEFSAQCLCEGTRVSIDRLIRKWESPNGERLLTGARIEKIAPEQKSILREYLKKRLKPGATGDRRLKVGIFSGRR